MNGRICCAKDLRTRNVLIKVLDETVGMVPERIGNTSAAKRAYYAEALLRMIINVPSPEVDKALGHPCAVDAYEVDDPTAAALKAQEIFEQYGFEGVKVYDELEPEFPKGFMVFVVVPALRGLVLLYWPPKPDKNVLIKFEQSGVFGKWTEADGAID